jgi:hypothetical protein
MNQIVACARLHELLESLPLYAANVESGLLPSGSGIYYFYSRTGTSWEPSGHPQGPKGLVRIGISGGARGRVHHHYYGVIPIDSISVDTFCPKDRSIMRKHIGRALLSSPTHPNANYLQIWNVDLTSTKNRDAYRHRRNIAIEQALEREVSAILARDFYFRCVPCETAREAGELETSGIGIVSSCLACKRSEGWLGRQHPSETISHGKLWNVRKVNSRFSGPLRLDLLARRIKEML